MTDSLIIALAQLNPVMGDIHVNVAKLTDAWEKARAEGADLIITPELFLTGYPPEDFALKPRHHKVIRQTIENLARQTAGGPSILVGTPWIEDKKIYNAVLLLDNGEIVEKRYKHDLPNYGPFDEKRVYTEGPLPKVIEWRGHKLGVMICEDMWHPDVAQHLKKQQAEILLVINGSPYITNKQPLRHSLVQNRVMETKLPLVYINQVGGQDQLIFEGSSFVFDSKGKHVLQAPAWEESIRYVDCDQEDGILQPRPDKISSEKSEIEMTYLGLMMSIRDFVTKNRFERVLLGLSGGIDSALVASLAVDALGADKVRAVMMPSPYTSEDSLEDAALMAKGLGCRLDTVPIANIMKAFDQALVEQFMGCEPDVTEENIQARARGMILMAISNKSHAMVLSTGNKSEMAVGYATLYGDMCGGYAPLKDVYKTKAYELAHWRNQNKPKTAKAPDGAIFPERILTKAPTAELRPNQKDADSLPPYDVLDKILNCMIEQNLGVAETITMGQDSTTIRRICMMLDAAEHKRRQSPPGPKVTSCHLGLDRRYPITNRYADRWQTKETD